MYDFTSEITKLQLESEFLDTINKSKTNSCKLDLSPMVLKGDYIKGEYTFTREIRK